MDKILKQFKENEASNSHCENYVLLAKHFGDESLQKLADQNLRHRDRQGYVDDQLNNECYEKIMPFYHKYLVKRA